MAGERYLPRVSQSVAMISRRAKFENDVESFPDTLQRRAANDPQVHTLPATAFDGID